MSRISRAAKSNQEPAFIGLIEPPFQSILNSNKIKLIIPIKHYLQCNLSFC